MANKQQQKLFIDNNVFENPFSDILNAEIDQLTHTYNIFTEKMNSFKFSTTSNSLNKNKSINAQNNNNMVSLTNTQKKVLYNSNALKPSLLPPSNQIPPNLPKNKYSNNTPKPPQIRNNTSLTNKKENKDKTKVECNQWKKTFSTKHTLNHHKNTHTK